LLHLKNRNYFSADVVDDTLVVGAVRYAGFWQQLSSGSISSSTSIQRLQALGCTGSSRSYLGHVGLIFEKKRLKVKLLTETV